MKIEIARYGAASKWLVLATGGENLAACGLYEVSKELPAEEVALLPPVNLVDAAMTLNDLRSGSPALRVLYNEEEFTLKSFAVLNPTRDHGDDELVDYSVLDFFASDNRWVSRFPRTATEKIFYSKRYREITNDSLVASLYLPFCGDSFNDGVFHVVDHGGGVVTDLEIFSDFDGLSIPTGADGGAQWQQHFWSAELTEQTRGADAITVALQLKWNSSGNACYKKTPLSIETTGGYLPHTKVKTDAQGRAVFNLIPIGLAKGDAVKIKVSAKHFTNVGSLLVTV
jgi:hypothetical protein